MRGGVLCCNFYPTKTVVKTSLDLVETEFGLQSVLAGQISSSDPDVCKNTHYFITLPLATTVCKEQ